MSERKFNWHGDEEARQDLKKILADLQQGCSIECRFVDWPKMLRIAEWIPFYIKRIIQWGKDASTELRKDK